MVGTMESSEVNPYARISELAEVLRQRVVHMMGQEPEVRRRGEVVKDHFEFYGERVDLSSYADNPATWRFYIEYDGHGAQTWIGRGSSMVAAYEDAGQQLTTDLQTAARAAAGNPYEPPPTETKLPLWPRWTNTLQAFVQGRIDEAWWSMQKQAPAGTDVWVRRFMQEGREWTFRVSQLPGDRFPENQYDVGIGLSDDAAVGGVGETPILAGMDAVAALRKACDAYHAKATRQTFTAGTHDKRNIDPDRLMEAFLGPLDKLAAKPKPRLPPYTVGLGAFLMRQLVCEWVSVIAVNSEPRECRCSFGGRTWELKVSRLSDGLYLTEISTEGHGGVGGQGACSGDADAFAIGALREECAKENPPMPNITKRQNPHMGTGAEQLAAKEARSRPMCRDEDFVRQMNGLAGGLYVQWVNEGESDTWYPHSKTCPSSPWGVSVLRADLGWTVQLTHRRTREYVQAVHLEFSTATRDALVMLSKAYPEHLRPEVMAVNPDVVQRARADELARDLGIGEPEMPPEMPAGPLHAAAAGLALEAERGFFHKTISLAEPNLKWGIAVGPVEGRDGWMVEISRHDDDGYGMDRCSGHAPTFTDAYLEAFGIWTEKATPVPSMRELRPFVSYVDARRRKTPANALRMSTAEFEQFKRDKYRQFEWNGPDGRPVSKAPEAEPVPILQISPGAGQMLGAVLAGEFKEFVSPPEGQATIQSRVVPGGRYSVQLTVLPEGIVTAEVSWPGHMREQTVSPNRVRDFAERLATAVGMAIEKAVSATQEGYKPSELSYAEEHEPDPWNEVPTPHEPPKEEEWPASQHGGMKWLN